MNPGIKSTEFVTTIASMLAVVVPIIADKVPAGSIAAVILGAVAAAATYVAGRSYVKGAGLKADGLRAAAEAAKRG